MSNDTNSNDGSYEFNHDNISKTKMRSFRVNNKLSKLLDNTAAADGMSSNGTEYDKLKAVMRAKYLKNEPEADSSHISTTVNQLQETLAKAKSLLESMESNESDYYKSIRERARNFVAKEPKESSVSTSQEISSSETPEEKQESPEVIDLELDDEMIDEVIEEAEKEESEKSDLTQSDNSQEETDIAENTIKYQLKFESESEESEQEENMEVEESNIDQTEQKSIFGQVSSIFGDETNLFNNTAKNDESYEEKMKSLQASISQKLENTAKEKEIATNNEEIAELTKTENELDKKIREQNDLIAGYKEKIVEKEIVLNSAKAECKSYLDELKSKDSIVSQYTDNFTITKQRIDELIARLTPKVNDAKEVVKKIQDSYESLMSQYDDVKISTSTAEQCQELLSKKKVETWKDLLDELNAFYDGVISKIKQKQFSKKLSGSNEFAEQLGEKIEEKKELVEKHIIEEEEAKERELLSKKVEVDNQPKQTSDHDAPSTNDLAFESLTVDPKTDMNDDHESVSDVSDTVEESQDEGTSFSNGDLSSEEDAISNFYRDNNIKEGELLKTVVSQTVSAPMDVPETETLTIRQNSVKIYNKLSDNVKNKVTSAFSSVRNSISNPFASKRKRDDASEIVTDEEQRKLDESDIEKIEDTIRKRVKKSDGKYRVVKTYVKDINKGDLIKHPALINPEDTDEEIEYVTLVREKLVTNPTDEVIVISSDDE